MKDSILRKTPHTNSRSSSSNKQRQQQNKNSESTRMLSNLALSVIPALLFVLLYQMGCILFWWTQHFQIVNNWEFSNGTVTDLKVVQVTVDSEEGSPHRYKYLPCIEYQYQTQNGKTFKTDQFFFLNQMYDTPKKARAVIHKYLTNAKESREKYAEKQSNQQKLVEHKQQPPQSESSANTSLNTLQRKYDMNKAYQENPKEFLVVRYNPEFKTVARVQNPLTSKIYGAHTDDMMTRLSMKLLMVTGCAILAWICHKRASPAVLPWFRLAGFMAPLALPIGIASEWSNNSKIFKQFVYNEHMEEELVQEP